MGRREQKPRLWMQRATRSLAHSPPTRPSPSNITHQLLYSCLLHVIYVVYIITTDPNKTTHLFKSPSLSLSYSNPISLYLSKLNNPFSSNISLSLSPFLYINSRYDSQQRRQCNSHTDGGDQQSPLHIPRHRRPPTTRFKATHSRFLSDSQSGSSLSSRRS